MQLYSNKGLTKKQIEIRDKCILDFYTFIRVVAPYLQLGHCHQDLALFLQSEGTHKLVIYPRGHLKSKMLALYGVWLIIRNPAITLLTASATATLAEAQLFDMKRILDSPIISKLFPSLLGKTTEGTREKWTQQAINVEHPLRKEMGIRDNTIYAAGAGKNIVGLHFDELLLDDIIAPNTDLDPFTNVGREKASRWVSLAASVLNPGGGITAVGTRYHIKDLYGVLKELTMPDFDEDGNKISEEPVYKSIEAVVERDGDYLWPRKKAMNGGLYGFNDIELNKIKSQYIDTSQFYSQYYNDPSDPDNRPVDPNNFQYYNKSNLQYNYATEAWHIQGKQLKTYAGMDMASTMEKRSDYTAIAVIGIDEDGYRYVLDIKRMKTDKISVMSDMVFQAFSRWKFKVFKCETNAAQGLVANQIEADLRRKNAIFKWEKKASRGEKRQRILSILEPLYSTKSMFHFRGGLCEVLEDELLSSRPPHDDVADAVSMCMEVVPMVIAKKRNSIDTTNVIYNTRFGGIAF